MDYDDRSPSKRRRVATNNFKNARVKRMLDMSLYIDENIGTTTDNERDCNGKRLQSYQEEEAKSTLSPLVCKESTIKSVEAEMPKESAFNPNLPSTSFNNILERRSHTEPLYAKNLALWIDDSDEEPFSPSESDYIPDTESSDDSSVDFNTIINKCVKTTPSSKALQKNVDTPDSFKEILSAIQIRSKQSSPDTNNHYSDSQSHENQDRLPSHVMELSGKETTTEISNLKTDLSFQSLELPHRKISSIASTSTVCTVSNFNNCVSHPHNTQAREQPLINDIFNESHSNHSDNTQENMSNNPTLIATSECMEIVPYDPRRDISRTRFLTSQPSTETCHSSVQESVDSSNNIQIDSEVSEERPSRSRKRQRDEKSWAVNKSKFLKNLGKEYQSRTTNITRREKKMGSPCQCKRRCNERINEAERLAAFKYYWNLGDHARQWDHILSLVKSKAKRVELVEYSRLRTQTLVYTLPVSDGNFVTVCKKMFLATFDVNEKTVYSALDKQEQKSVFDLRGTHSIRPCKVPESTTESVIDHINLFPRKESHYLRKQTQREYLDEQLNRLKMHRLYLSWIKDNQVYENVQPATERWYTHVFNTKFNIGFFQPKKDLCGICSLYEQADPERKLQLEADYLAHIKNKEIVRRIKDIEKSTSDPSIKTVACFDLEKVLNLPQSDVGAFHYKRKYPVYNFTIYNILTKSGYCYVWHAQIAKRGANEIASCLWNFVQGEAARGIKEISFYSDNCTGQNRNRFVYALYCYAARMLNLKITHRFLQKGHTQNEGDSMHSCIEKFKKKQVLYVPDEMYSVIRNSKVNGQKYNVKEMTQQDFYNVKLLVDHSKNWEKDNSGDKVQWAKIKEVAVDSPIPASLCIKYDFEAESICIETNRGRVIRKKRTPQTENVSADHIELKQLYNAPLPISLNLYKDLMSLCKDNYIPPHYHGFYNSLRPQTLVHEINSDMEDADD